jgi:hexosaminidase
LRTLCVMFILCVSVVCSAQTQKPIALMPLPSHFTPGNGQLVVDPSFTIALNGKGDGRLQRAVDRFAAQLRIETGMLPVNIKTISAEPATLVVHADKASKEIPELGEDESYTLEITSAGAKLNAPTTLGAMHGLQTFLQLVESTPAGFAVPAISIQDTPRFPWRGLMIDVGRHFIPLDVIKRNIDGMEAVKLNVFHWHLSENQGFRIESKKFPKLQELGSDGLFYTQAEVKDVIAYAADRGIRVVPEFDMPGHSTAWFVGYPELASGSGPYQIERQWGVFDPAMDPTRDSTYKFLDTFIEEMTDLFPDHYFHIGGDEVNGKEWDANKKVQDFKREHNIKSNADLQAYFSGRVQKLVSKHGKITVGWDEVLQPDVPKNILIQSWRGQASLAQAAKGGYSGILSSGYYLDLAWSTSRHYAVDPMTGPTADLTDDQKKFILGGEACMWAEYVSPENIDSRIWPRAAAIAERFWSPQNTTDLNSMYARMALTSRKLDNLGLTHNSSYPEMLRRIAGSDNISALRALADVSEPVKDYAREELAPVTPTGLLPLNRLVDAVRPESITARDFDNLVTAFTAGNVAPGTEEEIRSLLMRWRNNQTDIQASAEQSFLMKEVVPLSQSLSVLGTAGLEALDFLDRRNGAPQDWKTQQLAAIEDAKKPKAQLLIMVAPSVQKLVEAAAGQTVNARSH